MNRKVELLAPAGSPESFYGAIHAGADAVYLAGNRFGARAYADNFTTEELVNCIRYAHLWGKKVYLTVNTLIKEDEFDQLYPYLAPFYEAGLDGVIIQDLGVFHFIKQHFPGLELHVSTQMTLTGVHGASLLKEMGAVRIVPARELSLKEIKTIKDSTGLEIETFIHGAMCYCYSGQCLFSSILGGRSGNRGRCAQPCRLPYQVEHNGRTTDACYPLSLKDMCTIEHIPELIEAGIDSFKIEGRMKKPEYAAGVTAIYRKYIDKYYAGESCKVSQQDLDHLGKLYIRSERQNGYYFRHNGKDMVTLSTPSYSGSDDNLLLSIRNKYLSHSPKIKLAFEASFQVDKPAFLRCRCVDAENIAVGVFGDNVSHAMKQPISEDNLQKQLRKLGETSFVADTIQVQLDPNAFYPLKAINELRRQAIEAIEDKIIEGYGLISHRCLAVAEESKDDSVFTAKSQSNNLSKSAGAFHVSVRNLEQLQVLVPGIINHTTDYAHKVARLYLEADNFIDKASAQLTLEYCKQLADAGCMIVLALPYILRQRDELFLEKIWQIYQENITLFGGFLVRNMDAYGFLIGKGFIQNDTHGIFADAGFYIWNKETAQVFAPDSDCDKSVGYLNGFCLPYELTAREQRQLLKSVDSVKTIALTAEKIVYSRIPLMLTANCIANSTQGCDKNTNNSREKISYLTDRYHVKFPVLRNCMHCMNIVYNSLPLSLHTEVSKWRQDVNLRLDFTIEDGKQTEKILNYFLSDCQDVLPYEEYTTGHEKRGAE